MNLVIDRMKRESLSYPMFLCKKKTVLIKRSFFISFFVRKIKKNLSGNDKIRPLACVIYMVRKLRQAFYRIQYPHKHFQ